MLDRTNVDRYHRDGFLILPEVIDLRECDRLQSRALELVDQFEPDQLKVIFSTTNPQHALQDYFLQSGDKIRFFFEEEAIAADGSLKVPKHLALNKIGHALHDLDPIFDQFSRQTVVKNMIKDLALFRDPKMIQSMYIFKQPSIGGAVRCHQDATYLDTSPKSVVGLWFALEDATVDNGCLWAIPGGHRGKLRELFRRNPDNTTDVLKYTNQLWEHEALIPLEVKKGSVIVLDGLVPHASYQNQSPNSRHAYTLHLIEGSHTYMPTNWLQRSPDLPVRGFDSEGELHGESFQR